MDGSDATSGADPAGPKDVQSILAALPNDEARLEQIREWLDGEPAVSRAFWEAAKAVPLRVGKFVFLGDSSAAKKVLEDSENFRVDEYDRRMRATSGRFYLGMDGKSHERDAKLGQIIPAWNRPPDLPPSGANDAAQQTAKLQPIEQRAMMATLAALASITKRTMVARVTDPDALCEFQIAELLGIVLDACSNQVFGVSGPSSLSLSMWAKEITWYHFRVHANDFEDKSGAVQASGQFRSHIISQLASAVESKNETLLRQADEIRSLISKDPASVSDEDVARNLMNIITGSLTATAKGFAGALHELAKRDPERLNRIFWDRVPASTTQQARSACPYSGGRYSSPLYDSYIASTLRSARRGSLDSVYRTFVGSVPNADFPWLKPGDIVTVWLGGALEIEADYLFGIGLHACPGKDMAKAIMQGMLRALESLHAHEPRMYQEDEQLMMAFDDPRAVHDHCESLLSVNTHNSVQH